MRCRGVTEIGGAGRTIQQSALGVKATQDPAQLGGKVAVCQHIDSGKSFSQTLYELLRHTKKMSSSQKKFKRPKDQTLTGCLGTIKYLSTHMEQREIRREEEKNHHEGLVGWGLGNLTKRAARV